MTTRFFNVLLRAALVVALVASTALFVDYRLAANPAFCGVQEGCAQVRASAYSHVLGIPLPTLGLGAFVGVYVTACWASTRRHAKMVALLCVVAALAALGLIGLQRFVIHAVCAWCMAVDGAAIVAALCALAVLRLPPDRESRGLRHGWGGIGLAAVAVPLIWGSASSGGQVPSGIVALQRPDRVDIINFTDFECPFCRQLHSVLEELAAAHPDQVRVVRLMVPLAYHRGAKPAALGYLCAPEPSRQQLAERFYAAGPGELSLPTVAKLGVQHGLEAEPFVSCLAAPATLARLAEQIELFKQTGLTGIPATIVEGEMIAGADLDGVRTAVERAVRGDSRVEVRWMFGSLALLTALMAAVSLWAARRSAGAPPSPAPPSPKGEA
ncbi:MAG: thioredoxin domain-containing protein [Deltaproteobacteria bacterium]|nr:thioredoxin domain-containing protein [Deltaproteobacteria bacterium]